MQGLGAEDDVHIGRTLAQGFPFLGGDAATHAYHQSRFFQLELLPATELVEHLLLGLFTDGAGIEQQDVCLLGLFGQRVAIAGVQQVGHLGRVVLVHLAAPGLDMKFLAHCYS
ncbi:hypothetical protein D3C84_706250 [compost metagenome]